MASSRQFDAEPSENPPGSIGATSASNEAPETTLVEMRAWYAIDWASSLYATLAIGGFMPLLLQSCALAAANYPQVCPNVIGGAAQVASVFPPVPGYQNVTSMYFLADALAGSCPDPLRPACVNGYCHGLPQSVNDCREADGLALHQLFVAGTSVDPTSFATLSISLSVGAQVFAFIALGAAADFGSLRKLLLIVTSLVGGVFTAATAGVTPATWWLGMPLMIVSNVCFGMSTVMYNSYLPLLVRAHPKVRAAVATAALAAAEALPVADFSAAATPAESGLSPSAEAPAGLRASPSGIAPADAVASVELRVSDAMSNAGFLWGYVAGIVGITLCVPWAFLLSDLATYQIAMALSGVWWSAFISVPWRWLLPRPGPPLPAGSTYARESVRAICTTWAEVRQLPITLRYIVLWLFFSDGVFICGTLGGLFANSEVDWGCVPKGIGILLVFFLVPVCAAAGNVLLPLVQRRWALHSRTMLLGTLYAAAAIPAYGMIALVPGATVGIRQAWEMLLVAVWYGGLIGAMQAYSRSVFAPLIPAGREGAFFSVYELTNRGSSALGPLVLTVVQQATGNLRWGLPFVLLSIVLPAALLARLDVDAGVQAASAWSAEHSRRGGGGTAAARHCDAAEGGGTNEGSGAVVPVFASATSADVEFVAELTSLQPERSAAATADSARSSSSLSSQQQHRGVDPGEWS